MAILASSGRIVIAESIGIRDLHLAWGQGDGAWVTPPAENSEAVALQSEVGRRTVTQVRYVNPDPGGAIVLPSGNFTVSATPTRHLLLSIQFDFADSSSAVIREIGVFAGTVMVGGLPSGQQYFLPADVADPGRLLHIENIEPIYRSSAIRESFEIVITF